jgi:tRNA-dihydrouridine synthase B
VSEAGVAAIAVHPRAASAAHRGQPDYALVAELVRTLDAPVILSGGLDSAAAVRLAFDETGAAAVMLARGALGNPWLFSEVLGLREGPPGAAEVLEEVDWVIARAGEHLGVARAIRYLRRFYPWYVERLALTRHEARALDAALVAADSFDAVRGLFDAALAARAA